eukprot:CAMPEP_0175164494 /NCGR_PEP_ID=MMETSP0087-20121206/26453_1 /TAXON_ID=136419 /ORGANISM="Unknown Unknown, Strain D1" /LENGTH=59 /DNA_ID=CAMNT_0016453549 /DNA_START=487 /DNA_END=666 /DNA_ORIENTATION=+
MTTDMPAAIARSHNKVENVRVEAEVIERLIATPTIRNTEVNDDSRFNQNIKVKKCLLDL